MAQLDSDVILGGRYRLLRRIASGGMGSVWEAEDTILHRKVAVKVLSEALAEEDRFVERFRREARAAAGLSHPNVAGVFDYGEDCERPFIVMELIDGETLADRLRRQGRLPWPEAVAIAGQVAGALEAAHRTGIVHRDVKPGNIMLTPSGNVKVMDFGIAAATWAAPLTATGTAMGTATYISPEQTSGKRATPESDVYSLGVVLYEMLTGEPPFTGDTPVAVAMAHVRDTPPPLRQRAPDVPAHVDLVTQRALAKDPKLRPPSAVAFASMLMAPQLATGPLSADANRQDGTAGTGPEGDTIVLPESSGTAVLPTGGRVARSRQRDRRPGRGALIALGLAFILLAGILAAALARGGKPSAPGRSPTPPASIAASVPVPDVMGLSQTDAIARLQDAGLTWRVVVGQGPDGVDPGTVFDVTPPGGTQVARGSSVTLSVAAPCGKVGGGQGKHDKHCNGGGD
jgi:predicted Ser/Thr protein kinase